MNLEHTCVYTAKDFDITGHNIAFFKRRYLIYSFNACNRTKKKTYKHSVKLTQSRSAEKGEGARKYMYTAVIFFALLPYKKFILE